MSPSRTSRLVPRALRVLLAAFRLILVAVALQMSGAAQAAELIVDACGDDADCCTDCPIEMAGRTCPPGCPNCHCHHGGVALTPTPANEAGVATIPRDHRSVVRQPRATVTPREPFRSSIYRPPRSARWFT